MHIIGKTLINNPVKNKGAHFNHKDFRYGDPDEKKSYLMNLSQNLKKNNGI